jgi:hypothetical protein
MSIVSPATAVSSSVASAWAAPLPLAAGASLSVSVCAPPLLPAVAGAEPLPVAISARTVPTATVSPSAARILTTVPLAGAGTSASTLSRRDLDENLVGLDRVALLLVPLEDGPFGHRLSHLREGDLHCRVDRHICSV